MLAYLLYFQIKTDYIRAISSLRCYAIVLLQHSVENAEHLIKRLESFITTTMDANDDRINSVVALGRQLIAENNYASDKIQQKTDSLEDR